MIAELLERYDELIDQLHVIGPKSAINAFLNIHSDRQKSLQSLTAENKNAADVRARELVREFVSAGNEENFFEKIEEIRSNTLSEYEERFNNSIKQHIATLDIKEAQFTLALKEYLAKKSIVFGKLADKNLEWTVIGVDPFQQSVKLFIKEPLDTLMFKENGWTFAEDGDSEFDCPELACGWRDSDVRKYLNTDFYHQAFSEEEKQLILKTKRHINRDDCLITNDISEDYVYLLDLEEFLMLPSEIQKCESRDNCDYFWLAEQKSRGWADTGELPEIYATNCESGKLDSFTGDTKLLTRFSITVDLELFVKRL